MARAIPVDEAPIRSLSVLMPTWQGVRFLDRALASLAAQRCSFAWDFSAIDSGSTDGTLDVLDRWRRSFPVPFALRHIHKVEFDHGDTRNLLAALSTGDLLVFLTQDAIPLGEQWLERLAANFRDPRVGGAYCRNVARADAEPLTAILSAADPGYAPARREVRLPDPEVYAAMSPHERRVLYNFNDVASAVRRTLWQRHPFPRTWFGEDVLMARALLEGGYTVVYDGDAAVEHSHDYSADEMRERGRIDGRFNAEWLGRIQIASRRDAEVLADRLAPEDARAIGAAGFQGEPAEKLERRARELRKATFLGMWEGGQSQARRAPTALLERTQLALLFVVHGFPPDTWAGTEVYTFHLAQQLQARGHRVSILCRAPAAHEEADGGPADFHVEQGVFEGLRVLRMTNRLRNRRLSESYRHPAAEQAFREILARERPDLVHFQHLIHLSAGLVAVARELGLPTIVHCHDYWALCARVQMIRPDGVRCAENMGAGCYLCVKERRLDLIPLAKGLGAITGRVAVAFADLLDQDEFRDLSERHAYVPSAYAAADLCISPSRFLREKFLAAGRFDPHAFLYSDNGMRVDRDGRAHKRPDPEGRVRFGFVGSLVWFKGGETLVRAMAELAGRPAVALVFGSFQPARDAHHAELERLARTLRAPIEFRGPFDNRRLAEVHEEIDVLVVPSIWYENSPVTIHEAWTTRTPVVASRLGGMAEFVREGVNGLLFEPGDAHDLARVLARFLDEPDLVASLSRDFPAPKTIEENAAELEFRYRALVAARRRADPAVLLDAAATQARRRSGSVEQQGADMLLLRPTGASVEYDFEAGAARSIEVEIDVYAIGHEVAVRLGGRVLLDGREIGRIPAFEPHGRDQTHVFRLRGELARANGRPHALRIDNEPALGEAELYLRLKRVVVRAAPPLMPAPPEAVSA